MNRELLEKPFAPDQIKQREGRDGLLDYVEGHSVIARLNEAFDGHWSFEIMRHDILLERNEILALGKLSADGVVKMQFGASRIERDETSNEIVCLGDDLKAAGTDALKKCATFLGVGLHLYGERPASRSSLEETVVYRQAKGAVSGAVRSVNNCVLLFECYFAQIPAPFCQPSRVWRLWLQIRFRLMGIEPGDRSLHPGAKRVKMNRNTWRRGLEDFDPVAAPF